MQTFDAILISASPLALSEALLLARQGQRVLVVDRRSAIGGAWRKEDVLGYSNVEVGCHLFIEHAAIPVMASRLWGLQLAPVIPAPKQLTYFRGPLVEERYGSSGAATVKHGLSAVRKARDLCLRRRSKGLSWSDAARTAWHGVKFGTTWVRELRGDRPGFYYPRGGTAEIVAALHARAAEAGITLLLGREVIAATTTSTGARVDLDSGEVVDTRQLVLTRGSQLPTINGLTIPQQVRRRRHWVVVLDDPTPRAFSYLQFMGHPLLERVSDVTSFAQAPAGGAVEPGRKILCFYVNNRAHDAGRTACEQRLLDLVRSRRWVGSAAAPLANGWWEDEETSRSYQFLTQLAPHNPGIRVVPHINLGRYLADNIHRIV